MTEAGQRAKLTGRNPSEVTIRSPQLQFVVTRWNWSTGKKRDKTPIDITNLAVSMIWQKTIKNPSGGCSLTCIPQRDSIHLLDDLNPLDVVNIYEFGVLKFQGYIWDIRATGGIDPSGGRPIRFAMLSIRGFGGIFTETALGVNMWIISQQSTTFSTEAKKFSNHIADIIKSPGGLTYAGLVQSIVQEWISMVNNIVAGTPGATSFYTNYISTYLNYTDGLVGAKTPGFPRELAGFYGVEQQITLWDILQKIAEVPFVEIFFDNGPRQVFIEQSNDAIQYPAPLTTLQANKEQEQTYLIVRQTPFDGTVLNGVSLDFFKALPAIKIPLGHFVDFSFRKTMEESASFYFAIPPIFNPGTFAPLAEGDYILDAANFSKYLYRPLTSNLYYTRFEDLTAIQQDSAAPDISKALQDACQTLSNWNTRNDQYLSGVLSYEVPSVNANDPKIGEKVVVEGVDDAYFYCEGVAHSWSYGKELRADASVTRGFGMASAIQLKSKIFKRGRMVI